MNLSNETLIQIELATRRAYPLECCGFLLTEGTFQEQKNISPNDKTSSFAISPLVYLENRSNIVAIVHSHTKRTHLHPQTPSIADMELADALAIPMYISAFVDGVYYQPLKVPPEPSNIYANRPYIFGVSDCGLLIRDFYHFEFNIAVYLSLASHLTPKKDWESLVKTTLETNALEALNEFNVQKVENAIQTNSLIDVSKVSKLQKGDLLITSILGYFNNHAMIYIGSGMLLNQAEVSKIEPLELYLNKITKVYRHPSLMEGVCK